MSIVSLRFSSGSWQLNETHFNNLNLLVGISGAGKTKTLQAFHTLREAGLKGARNTPSCRWAMQFRIDEHSYLWKGEILSNSEEEDWSFGEPNENAVFLNEHIERDGIVLVDRDHASGKFLFNNEALPKLKWTESAITLLAGEDDLTPLKNALQCIISSDRAPSWHYETQPPTPPHWESLTELQSATQFPWVIRAKELQDKYPDHFNEIKSYFIEIFQFVEDVQIVNIKKNFHGNGIIPFDIWTVAIKEKDVDRWIVGPNLSTGMFRTLKLLLELALVPKGTLFLVDEFENSLGINCLPQVVEMVNRRQGEIQFILTSHHPYVINNIPWSAWKLVTRRGSVVTIRDVAEIPSLQTRSSLDRFYLLINAPEYQEGIA
ncbi:MAG: ATP-binding protein [Magnetococcales bacterium]|nr:ATP-binding protein [Magnetococcales bacterium]